MPFDQQTLETLAPLVGRAVVWVQQQVEEAREREIQQVERQIARLEAMWRDQWVCDVPADLLGHHAALTSHLWREVWSKAHAVESFVAVLAREGQELAEVRLVARGGVDRVSLDSERFPGPWLALHAPLTAIVVAHHHPSGSIQVSREDRNLHESIADACEERGIALKGALVVSQKKHIVVSCTRGDAYAWKED